MMIRWFDTLSSDDVALVGGKNASLGELTTNLAEAGVQVPYGFSTTSDVFWSVLDGAGLRSPILELLEDDNRAPADTAAEIRSLIEKAELPDAFVEALAEAYRDLGARYNQENVDVAVRSSATAEDLPEASFAGQQDSFLNVSGIEDVVAAVRKCFASLFTERAIYYRNEKGFDHTTVALSVGVQKMVRSDQASAGVLFTLDTETGFPDVSVINAAWGLGEAVVSGEMTPDEYRVYTPFLEHDALTPIIGRHVSRKARKYVYADGGSIEVVPVPEAAQDMPVLTDADILQLARWGASIEAHYGQAMDIEWAKDGETGEMFIVQARPETVQSRIEAATLRHYSLTETSDVLVTGAAIGDAIATGPVCRLDDSSDLEAFVDGGILVTEMTDPDWVPLMKRASAIVTDRGGRTSHAAIVSREMGLPAIVGTGNASSVLQTGQEVTVSCAQGDEGQVLEGMLDFEVDDQDLSTLPEIDTQIMINVASPPMAMKWWRLPVDGVGLARMEYIINNIIEVHPLALTRFDQVEDVEAREQIEKRTAAYDSKPDYFVKTLARGIATIAAAHYPDPVIVRMSDFKTNEYANLIGGQGFEPDEENPMLGWRGAARYYSDDYADGFALEYRALRMARQEMGFDNIVLMIPFCRTPDEGREVLNIMANHGLRQGENGLKVYAMAEVPSNIVLADQFSDLFDGFSIGSNDLTQLTLGVDRDSDRLAYLFDERNEAVTRSIQQLIDTAHDPDQGRAVPVGICGQGPSDHPEFAALLVGAGIDSISVLPDSVGRTIRTIAEVEANRDHTAEGVSVAPQP
ncbi:MAG: phosphoenolpyruvate synthase [Bacteroidetes bacterium]|jgi:pyruvate,water dikinase|nr:phosphoenolpyruvate synthase [Bacteroidota bacterium]